MSDDNKTYSPREAVEFLRGELSKAIADHKTQIERLLKAQEDKKDKEFKIPATKELSAEGSGGKTKAGMKLKKEEADLEKAKHESATIIDKPKAPVKVVKVKRPSTLEKAGVAIGKVRGSYTGKSMGRADGALKKGPGGMSGMSMPKPPVAPQAPKAPGGGAMPKMAGMAKSLSKGEEMFRAKICPGCKLKKSMCQC